MAKSRNRYLIFGCLGILTALASPCAMAGSSNNVTLTFINGAAVPLDHWSSMLAFGMIAIAAYFLLRRQGNFGRLWQWVVVAMVAGAGAYGLRQYDLIGSAYATAALTSPYSTRVSCPQSLLFANTTSQTIQITGVTWNTAQIGTCFTGGNSVPQCAPGLSLVPSAGCYLQLTLPVE